MRGTWSARRPALAIAAFAALVLVAAGTGCARLSRWSKPFGPPHELPDVQQRYTQLIRWNEFAKASDFVEPELRSAFLTAAADLEQVRFSDYEVQRLDPSEDGLSATALVRYRAYWLDYSVELPPVVETQAWRYDEGEAAWRVRPDLVALRAALLRSVR